MMKEPKRNANNYWYNGKEVFMSADFKAAWKYIDYLQWFKIRDLEAENKDLKSRLNEANKLAGEASEMIKHHMK